MNRDKMKETQSIEVPRRYFRVHRPGIVQRAAACLHADCDARNIPTDEGWVKEMAPLTLEERKQVRAAVTQKRGR